MRPAETSRSLTVQELSYFDAASIRLRRSVRLNTGLRRLRRFAARESSARLPGEESALPGICTPAVD